MIIRFLTVGLLAPRPTRNLENHALSLFTTARSLYKSLCLALELYFWKSKIRAKHLFSPSELFKITETLVFEVPVNCQRKVLIRDWARFFQDPLGKICQNWNATTLFVVYSQLPSVSGIRLLQPKAEDAPCRGVKGPFNIPFHSLKYSPVR